MAKIDELESKSDTGKPVKAKAPQNTPTKTAKNGKYHSHHSFDVSKDQGLNVKVGHSNHKKPTTVSVKPADHSHQVIKELEKKLKKRDEEIKSLIKMTESLKKKKKQKAQKSPKGCPLEHEQLYDNFGNFYDPYFDMYHHH